MRNAVSPAQAFSFGLKHLCDHLSFFLLLSLVSILILAGVSVLIYGLLFAVGGADKILLYTMGWYQPDPELPRILSSFGIVSLLSAVVLFLVHRWLYISWIIAALDLYTSGQASIGCLKPRLSLIVKSCFAALLYWLAVGIGLALFVLPGVYLAVRWWFFQQLLIEQDCGILKPLQQSGELVKNDINSVCNFILLLLVLSWLVICACAAALMLFVPVAILGQVCVYKRLKGSIYESKTISSV